MLQGYRLTTKLHETSQSVIYRGYMNDNTPVIIKILNGDYPSPIAIARFRREYDILRSLDAPYVIKAHALEKYNNSFAIITEDIGGMALADRLKQQRLNLREFLTLALKMTEGLGAVHQRHFIHKDINPANIVYNSETGALKIIDFGLTTAISRENPEIRNFNVMEGTLTYISPEQTGRMNRALDYRTDFYSLGVTFYEMLVGSVPFDTTDTLELVHAHLAKMPRPPADCDPNIPTTVSDIIMKLIAKTAEDRYQSTHGLYQDLRRCLDDLETTGTVHSFFIGQNDYSDRFHLPQSLYGRHSEIEQLLAAFQRITTLGQSELMLVAGYSGIGKSALIHELHKPLVQQRGYFISGKFDQFQRNIPYRAVIQAFQELMHQLLTESEAQLARWRENLLAVLGPNGQVLIEVLPEVELIIGTQPPAPELPPAETQNRFNQVLLSFIRTFASAAHPLVMFVDDLQWADAASLKLIELFMTSAQIDHLLIIGAYRDNEVNSSHPLTLTLNAIQQAGAIVNSIGLSPLDLQDVNQFVADTLRCSLDRAKPLAELVLIKTNGNPFFMTEFLKSLHAEELLQFDFQGGGWQWDLAQIQERDITDNVVELMAGKVQQLPPATQEVLKLAACIGHQFDLATLAIVYQKSSYETANMLWVALQAGLIVSSGEAYKLMQFDVQNLSEELNAEYKFAHDRVQQAVYSLIPAADKQEIHWRIGQYLWQYIPLAEMPEHIFDIVNQLNLGRELATDQNERTRLAQLNLLAGQRAKTAIAYEPALRYLTIGTELLPDTSWQTDYALTLSLYMERSECEYLNAHFAEAETYFNLILGAAQTNLDKARVYGSKMILYMTKGQVKDAAQAGIAGLQLLDADIPFVPTVAQVEGEIAQVSATLGTRHIADLYDLPAMTDRHQLAIIALLSDVLVPAWYTNMELFCLTTARMVNLSLQYGNTDLASYGYSWYGVIAGSRMGDYKSGYEYGELALRLNQRYNNVRLNSKVYCIFGVFLQPWRDHIRDGLVINKQGYQAGLEIGDWAWAGINSYTIVYEMIIKGDMLDTVYQECQAYLDSAQRTKQAIPTNMIIVSQQFILCMKGMTKAPETFSSDQYDEEQHIQKLKSSGMMRPIYWYYKIKMQSLVVFHKYEAALIVANECEVATQAGASFGSIERAQHFFYFALIITALYPTMNQADQAHYGDLLRRNVDYLQIWAENAPANFSHKFMLVSAEVARLEGRDIEAETCYQRAIQDARNNDYIQDEALACELAAQFYLERGYRENAQHAIREAHYAYARWGASAKVQEIEQRHIDLMTPLPKATTTTTTASVVQSTFNMHGMALDFTSVIRASQALSSEIVLETLLERLMRLVLENAGAQMGYLLFEKDGTWQIETAATIDEAGISFAAEQETLHDFPKSIINYVAHTAKEIVLANAALGSQFDSDPYIQRHYPKSVLCAPLLHKGKVAGMLYLENNLTTGAFTSERLTVLNLLASQAAISIENARLYTQLEAYSRDLEQKVEQRTAELAQATREAQEARTAAEAANESKSNFLANVSHELRTPLTSILGFARIIQRRLDERIFPLLQTEERKTRQAVEQISTNIGIILTEGHRLTTLINNVLDLEKIEAGKMDWRMDSIHIETMVKQASAAVTALFEQKGLTLVTEIEPDLPTIIGDEDKLIQVLINLLSNAVKFTPSGNVICRVVKRGTEAMFSIIDTGIGIAPEDQSKVFDKFKQVGDTLTDKPKGTGLGLPICKEIVQHHQGQLWVESALGQGSTFAFTLPIVAPTAPKPIALQVLLEQLRPHVAHVAQVKDGQRPTILVADDQAAIREMLRQQLEEVGYTVREATNGVETLTQVRQTRPDLIILDVMMPELNGFDVASTLRNDPSTMGIPIIILSIIEDKEKGYRLGVDRYLTKPVNAETLLIEIDALLTRGNSQNRVLLADQTAETMQALTEVLIPRGFIIEQAVDQSELLEKVIPFKPDMILLNSGFAPNQDIMQTLRIEKGLENVVIMVYA
jgi:predicted ATPase/signal transduction histidine kinase/DNA-binding response OmpR family regulator/tRNA A-37 threonylcarbamoyl transferase component Bud32